MYKRTNHDSPLKCPYCGKQFTASLRRRMNYKYGELNLTDCRQCKRQFYFRNITASYARENNLRATFKIEEV